LLWIVSDEGASYLFHSSARAYNPTFRSDEWVEDLYNTVKLYKPVLGRPARFLPLGALPHLLWPKGVVSVEHVANLRRSSLTPREREVVKMIAEGNSAREIATVLGLSVKTVEAHRFNLMRKLDIHNKAQLVTYAIQKKIVHVPAEA
jgi:DNA-binding CsgD family transcriptional regulator